jgi:hypothetical protein
MLMHEDDSERRVDHESAHRTEDGETHAPQAPVIRLLANPRRIRRA